MAAFCVCVLLNGAGSDSPKVRLWGDRFKAHSLGFVTQVIDFDLKAARSQVGFLYFHGC